MLTIKIGNNELGINAKVIFELLCEDVKEISRKIFENLCIFAIGVPMSLIVLGTLFTILGY